LTCGAAAWAFVILFPKAGTETAPPTVLPTVPSKPGHTEGSRRACELRRFYEPEDFGDAYTPELREQEERLRREAESR
jgi:hypothetical protein